MVSRLPNKPAGGRCGQEGGGVKLPEVGAEAVPPTMMYNADTQYLDQVESSDEEEPEAGELCPLSSQGLVTASWLGGDGDDGAWISNLVRGMQQRKTVDCAVWCGRRHRRCGVAMCAANTKH